MDMNIVIVFIDTACSQGQLSMSFFVLERDLRLSHANSADAEGENHSWQFANRSNRLVLDEAFSGLGLNQAGKSYRL